MPLCLQRTPESSARPFCQQRIDIQHGVLPLFVYPTATAHMEDYLAVTNGEVLNGGCLGETVWAKCLHTSCTIVKLVKVNV